MPAYDSLLIPEHLYHIFNRAVGDEKIFRTNENYFFFLKKFQEYTSPVAILYCYSLLPNHFHVLLKIKSLKEIQNLYAMKKRKPMIVYDNKFISEFIMEQFSNFFNSYTKSFNKVYNRKGKLFMDHLRRTEISDESYFSKIIHYIHVNPMHHGYCSFVNEWPFSSYNLLLDQQSTLPAKEIFDGFGGKEQFIKFHHQPVKRRSKP